MRNLFARLFRPARRQIAGDNSVQIMGDNISMTFFDELNPWRDAGVIALHSHTAEEPCDETCSVYER
jgi:hypothetical protein